MNEICIFTFSSRSNRINSRALLSRNVAEFHFCVQHSGHATKFLSYRTKNWTISRHIWHLEPKTNRIGSSVQPSVRAHFETGNRTEPRFGSVRFPFFASVQFGENVNRLQKESENRVNSMMEYS